MGDSSAHGSITAKSSRVALLRRFLINNEEIPSDSNFDGTPPTDQSTADPTSNFPVGLILIIILAGMGALGGLMSIINPMMVIGIYVISGFPAYLYGFLLSGANITLFVWLIQRKERGRILGIIISAYNMLIPGITLFSVINYPNEFMAANDNVFPGYSESITSGFLSQIVSLVTILSWIVGTVVILYLHFKKKHFRNG